MIRALLPALLLVACGGAADDSSGDITTGPTYRLQVEDYDCAALDPSTGSMAWDGTMAPISVMICDTNRDRCQPDAGWFYAEGALYSFECVETQYIRITSLIES